MRATHGCAFVPSSSSFRNCKRCVSYENEKETENLCRTSTRSPRPKSSLRSLPTSTPKRLSTRITTATATTTAPSSSLYSRDFSSSSSSIHSRSGSQTNRGRDSSRVTRARPFSCCCPPSQCQKDCCSTQKGVFEDKEICLSSSLQRKLSQDPKRNPSTGMTAGKITKQTPLSPGLNSKKDILADVCRRIARILDQVKTESSAYNTQQAKPNGETRRIPDSRRRKESEGQGAKDSCGCEEGHGKCVIRRSGVTPRKNTKKSENDEGSLCRTRVNEKAEEEEEEEKASGVYCPSCRSIKTSPSDKEDSYEKADLPQDHEENNRPPQVRGAAGNRHVACRYGSLGGTKKLPCRPATTTPRLKTSSLSPAKVHQKHQQKTPKSRNTSSQNTFHIARLEVGLKKTTEKNKALQEERKMYVSLSFSLSLSCSLTPFLPGFGTHRCLSLSLYLFRSHV